LKKKNLEALLAFGALQVCGSWISAESGSSVYRCFHL